MNAKGSAIEFARKIGNASSISLTICRCLRLCDPLRVSKRTQGVCRDTLSPSHTTRNSFVFNCERLAIRLQSSRAQALKQQIRGDAMTTLKLSRLAVVAGMAVVFTAAAFAKDAATPDLGKAASEPQAPKRVIVVSLEDRKLALVEDGQVKKVYSVAVGKPSTPSPVGAFTIERRVMNPTYHHGNRTVPPGPGNPVGTRWMGLSIRGYGIHGTNEPNSIGKAASHGCIRMGKADLEELYELVSEGDTVELVGERNDETAQLFGNGQNPAATPATAQPVLTATASPVAAPAHVASGLAKTEALAIEVAGLVAQR